MEGDKMGTDKVKQCLSGDASDILSMGQWWLIDLDECKDIYKECFDINQKFFGMFPDAKKLYNKVLETSPGHFHVLMTTDEDAQIPFDYIIAFMEKTNCDKQYIELVKQRRSFFMRVSGRWGSDGTVTPRPVELFSMIDINPIFDHEFERIEDEQEVAT